MYKKAVTSLLVISALTAFGSVQAGSIGPKLGQVLENSSRGDRVDVIIEFSDRLDTRRLSRKGKRHRREIIRNLKSKSNVSQRQVVKLLKGTSLGKSKQLWLVNSLATSIPATMVSKIASLPSVKSVKLDAKITLAALTPGNPVIPEWNLDAVNVNALWSQGITGQGAVVGSMDTGVDVNHPDLSSSWRGGTNSWFDPYAEHAEPYDALGHGTQTTGIMVGGNTGGTVIGMAPDAQWIAAKIFNDSGTATYSAIHAGFQWMMDPDGDPLTDDSPDVINNSWNLEGSLNLCDPEFQADIDALRAAGIAVVFSAGNSGPGSATSLSPANNSGSLAVGSVDFTLNVDFFSSRGPSACDAGTYPHISAPGSDILVADLTFGGIIPFSYTYASGTSFASAHVAGAYALLASGSPTSTLAERDAAIQQSAIDIGAAGDDNDYGWGLLDVGAAYTILTGTSPASTLQLSTTGYNVAENGASVIVTVNRTGDTTGTVTIDYSTADASATAGADYGTTSGTLTFADGVISQNFTVTILDDTAFEGDENFTVNLANVVNATLGSPSSSSITIIENDPQPSTGSLQFNLASYSVAENGANVVLTVDRIGGSFGTVSVDYSTINGTATAGSDYVSVTGGLVSFADGDAVSKTITIPVLDDAILEGDETFSVNLSNATGGAVIGATSNATVNIIDNETAQPGSLQFSVGGYSVNENGVNAVLTVTRTGGSDGAVSVSYTSIDGTATAGSDYVSVTGGLVSFADGDAVSKTITIPVLDDAILEGDETFSVNLSNATGGAVIGATSNATVNIIDNEIAQPGSLQFSVGGYSVNENGVNAVLTVTRTGGSDGAVSVSYTSIDGTATAGSDYVSVTGGLVSFANGDAVSKTITIPVLDDAVLEGDEAFSVNLSNATGGAVIGATSNATVNIIDNEIAQPGSLQFSVGGYSVNENGVNAVLAVTRTGGSNGAVSVSYTSVDGTATAGSDYSAVSGLVNFADGDAVSKTITIPVLDDAVLEGDETFSVNLSNATGGAVIGATSNTTVNIIDNDVAPPSNPDLDNDGFAQDVDCNDNDPNIYPGAPEVIRDGVDQDCNGYDLTIDIKKAVYKESRNRLTIEAGSDLRENANLVVEGFGSMTWDEGDELWLLKVNGLLSPPASITVTGIEGSVSVDVEID